MSDSLLPDFVKAYPAQPATAFWRAIEIAALLRKPLPDGYGLDLGCGDGKLTKLILDRSGPRSLVGIDVDPAETEMARNLGLYRKVLTAHAGDIPVESDCFDFVLSNSVMEHIPNLERVIAEVGRVLRRGGLLVTTVPTIGFHANLKGSLFPWISRQDYLTKLDSRLAHFHYLSSSDWEKLLERNGMTLTARFGYLDRAECRRWELLSRFTGGLLHTLSLGRRRPIEIQRSLGLRSLQARYGLPSGVANTISILMNAGRSLHPAYWQSREGLNDEDAGCLVVTAMKQ